MLHLFRHAVNPPLHIADALRCWPQIARALAERPRRRKRQMETLHKCFL